MDCIRIKQRTGDLILDKETLNAVEGACAIKQEIDIRPNKLVVCNLSGSHSYGFPSAKSDFDMRCIHVAPTGEVLKLGRMNETIKEGGAGPGEVDFVSHEIKKAMSLMLRSNPNILENLGGKSIVLAEEGGRLQELAKESVAKIVYEPYLGFSRFAKKDAESSGFTDRKVVLYAYRTLMTGIVALEEGRIEPDINKLNERFNNPLVSSLVEGHINETRFDMTPELQARIREDLAGLEKRFEDARAGTKLPDEVSVKEGANSFLLDVRRKNW